jgi:hypothetical protein
MILPQTDHAFLPKPKMPSLPATTSRSCRWKPSRSSGGATSCITARTQIIITAGRAQKARATSATIATSGMLGLLSPTPTMADSSSPPCSLTVIASTPHFRFCLRCARMNWIPPRKKCVVDKCHKSFFEVILYLDDPYSRRPMGGLAGRSADRDLRGWRNWRTHPRLEHVLAE